MRRITMRDIAERAGVTKMTVSLALRGAGRLSRQTVERVRALAEEMGYEPDPALQALNTHKQQLRTADKGEVIAFLVDGPVREPWLQHQFIKELKTGAEGGARRLGYRLNPFWLGDYPGKRLERMLIARGIRGLLLAPEPHLKKERQPLQLDWDRFCLVRLGRTHQDINVPSVTHDHFGSMIKMFEELMLRGYRRPALLHSRRTEERVQFRWAAAFQFMQQQLLPEADRLPLLNSPDPGFSEVDFWEFVNCHQPDVCISTQSAVLFYLRKAGLPIPGPIDFASLHIQFNQPDVTGIQQNLNDIGSSSIDLMDLLLRTNERGLSKRDHTIVLGGIWQEGITLRPMPERAAQSCCRAPA